MMNRVSAASMKFTWLNKHNPAFYKQASVILHLVSRQEK